MNDPFYLTDEQRMIRDLARKIARDRVAPHAARSTRPRPIPRSRSAPSSRPGSTRIWVPEEYGGTDMGCLALALVCRGDRLGVRGHGHAVSRPAARRAADPARGHRGAEEEVSAAAGHAASCSCAYSLSEPGAGSDAAGLKTTAVRRATTTC